MITAWTIVDKPKLAEAACDCYEIIQNHQGSGSGDDVSNSDRFYHWGALLGYVEYLERSQEGEAPRSAN